MKQDNRQQSEYERLLSIFQDLPEEKFEVAQNLILEASFLKVTLEDLQVQIRSQGTTDEYKNGANQYGRKTSAELQTYNQTVKNYALIIDKLYKYLDKDKRGSRETLHDKMSRLLESEELEDDE